ncbi:hypothetical protein HYE67_008288 [Fusarium culmorum]|uniref:ERF1 methyltransferase catalytic subunit MTQ2 n=1 Tax=Fusarium culmorum TaxID=5516 RepID=A0A7S8HYH1_FUSCU|nr:hypothetical protein HYE67_008288 [Fusarium culmorum]
MCAVTYFKHKKCKHTWVVLTEPCMPYIGLNTCPTFCDGTAKDPPKFYNTKSQPCPRCQLHGVYDRNLVRMVEAMGWGIKWGVGPGRDDWGCEMNYVSRAMSTQSHRKFSSCKSMKSHHNHIIFTHSAPHTMLPTPDTSHVPYGRVYEPAEDSYLLLDTLSYASETEYLQNAFPDAAPLVVEVGTGSGVVLAFVHAHAQKLFGTRQVLTAGVDMNAFACRATVGTVAKAESDNPDTHASYLGSCMGDLTTSMREGAIDVLIFNPPYVPTPEMPARPDTFVADDLGVTSKTSFDDDSYLLALSYAGGVDGMETTDRLIEALPRTLSRRGCAYLLLCAQNKPDQVKSRIEAFGPEWRAQTVGTSGKQAGWEKLQIVRIWRDYVSAAE